MMNYGFISPTFNAFELVTARLNPSVLYRVGRTASNGELLRHVPLAGRGRAAPNPGCGGEDNNDAAAHSPIRPG